MKTDISGEELAVSVMWSSNPIVMISKFIIQEKAPMFFHVWWVPLPVCPVPVCRSRCGRGILRLLAAGQVDRAKGTSSHGFSQDVVVLADRYDRCPRLMSTVVTGLPPRFKTQTSRVHQKKLRPFLWKSAILLPPCITAEAAVPCWKSGGGQNLLILRLKKKSKFWPIPSPWPRVSSTILT